MKKLQCDCERTFVMLRNKRRERTKLLLLPQELIFLADLLTLSNEILGVNSRPQMGFTLCQGFRFC
jgi:hypothetical protein